MHEQQSYYNLKLNINDTVSFTRAEIDRRYASEFGDLTPENGPYHGYSVVEFPDSDRFSPWSRIGVRKGGFHALAPLYYVRCKDILSVEDI